MRLIDANLLVIDTEDSMLENPHQDTKIQMNHHNEHIHFLSLIAKQPTVGLDNWVTASKPPIEHLCKDGEYDPSDYVLVQLDNGYMKVSRYWNHRHCKDTSIEQPWLDLEEWENVVVWQPLPTKYSIK